jgi:hypothetical protein
MAILAKNVKLVATWAGLFATHSVGGWPNGTGEFAQLTQAGGISLKAG